MTRWLRTDKDDVLAVLKQKDFRKFTGPPEHWLTTFNTKFWGLESKYRKKWDKDIDVGDAFVFHSTGIEYLDQRARLPTGVIGVGIVGGRTTKSTKEWIGEIREKNDWPLLVHFSEIWWFGDAKGIVDEPMRTKLERGEPYIVEDLRRLTQNCVTFEEMRQNGCAIPAQGSMQNISDARRGKLVDLIADRLDEAVVGASPVEQERQEVFEVKSEKDIARQIAKWTKNLRDVNLKETPEEAVEREQRLVSYFSNLEAQERASSAHSKTMLVLAKYLTDHGTVPKTSVIDLLAERGGRVFIFEVKSIRTENFRHQTRMAVGQLVDYEYFQVRRRNGTQEKRVVKCVVYSKKPPSEIAEFLEVSGFKVFWTERDNLEGTDESMRTLSDFLAESRKEKTNLEGD